MGNLKNRWKVFLIIFLIFILFCISRFFFLLDIPLFTDEAIYLRWAQIARGDFDWLLISLTDGKGPTFIWLAMLAMNVISDPLIAGRLVSVAAGIGSIVGLYMLSIALFKNRWVGFMSALIYTILPFTLVYDRLALYDSLVAALYIWGIYTTLQLTRKPNLLNAGVAGIVAGVGAITKSSGLFIIYLLPVLFALLTIKSKKVISAGKKWILYAGVTVLVAYGLYNLQRVSPSFYLIAQKNEVFIYSLQDWIANPFANTVSNIRTLLEWFVSYTTVPIIVLVLASFVVKKDKLIEKVLLCMYFIIPFLALAVFAKLIYPRYILFMTVSLIPLAGYALVMLSEKVANKFVYGVIVVLVLSIPFWASIQVLRDFEHAPIPGTDKGQLLTGWPSGVGVKESVQFFEKKAATEKIFVGTGGQFGLLPAGLELYLHDNPNIEIVGYWPITPEPQPDILQKARQMPTYFIFYQPCGSCEYEGDAPDTWPVEKIVEYKKPGENAVLSIYEVKPQP
jgi:4-amino-4-deoxy-L-arabinose transferase-like glycosyltransferase